MRIIGRSSEQTNLNQKSVEQDMDTDKRVDPYPQLSRDDPRRVQTDEEILYEKIDLTDSALSRKEKSRLMKMIIKYRDALLKSQMNHFSLSDHFQSQKKTNHSWMNKWNDQYHQGY